jgi:hypothetical protein
MLRLAIRRSRGHTDRLPVVLYVRNDNHAPRLVKLVATCGPQWTLTTRSPPSPSCCPTKIENHSLLRSGRLNRRAGQRRGQCPPQKNSRLTPFDGRQPRSHRRWELTPSPNPGTKGPALSTPMRLFSRAEPAQTPRSATLHSSPHAPDGFASSPLAGQATCRARREKAVRYFTPKGRSTAHPMWPLAADSQPGAPPAVPHTLAGHIPHSSHSSQIFWCYAHQTAPTGKPFGIQFTIPK